MRLASSCLLLVVACAPSDRRPIDTTAAAPGVPAVPVTPLVSAPDTMPPAQGGIEWQCNRAQSIVQLALNAPVVRDTARTFPGPVKERWSGCRYTAALSLPVDTPDAPDTPEASVRRAFEAAGWMPVSDYDASGPAAAAFAFRDGETLCHVADEMLVHVPRPGSRADTLRREPVPHAIELRCTTPVPVTTR